MEIINNKKIFFSALLIFFVIISIFFIFKNQKPKNFEVNQTETIQYAKIARQKIKVELALTPKAQEQGLSGKKELKENTGMLFIFDHVDKYNFWMKDMNFPIDMIWVDEDYNVIYIEKNALPISYPSSFGPNQNSKYVLEVNSGFSEKNNLKIGEKVEFLSA